MYVKKPEIGRRTIVGQAFDECFKDFPYLLNRIRK